MIPIKATTIDEYIADFPPETQERMQLLRATIKATAPEAVEVISYGMPAFKWNGILVYFAGYKNHIGFYATPTANSEFKKDLSVYKIGKGSIQFPLDQPLPLELVTRIVEYRLEINAEKAAKKK